MPSLGFEHNCTSLGPEEALLQLGIHVGVGRGSQVVDPFALWFHLPGAVKVLTGPRYG